ncbi:MAG: hypothetical protein KC503_02570 [Myxococcales bacterium]|nr:hypothetical protein [Myxococcales bacterium]
MRLARLSFLALLPLAAIFAVSCGEGSTAGTPFGPGYQSGPSSKSGFGPGYNNGPSTGTTDQVIDEFCRYFIGCAPRISDERSQQAVADQAIEQCKNAISGQGLDQIPSGILLAALSCMTNLPCSALSNAEAAIRQAYTCLLAAGLTNLPQTPPTTTRPDARVPDFKIPDFSIPDFSFPNRDSTVDSTRDAGSDADADLGV